MNFSKEEIELKLKEILDKPTWLKCEKCGLIIEGTHRECSKIAGEHALTEKHYTFKSKNGGILGIV